MKCRTCGRSHGDSVKHRAGWTYTSGKVKGAFGETDLNKKVIKIDHAKHKRGAKVKHRTPNPDGSENKLTTILHELGHANHPRKSEKGVEKLAIAMKSRLSKKQKQRHYAKFN